MGFQLRAHGSWGSIQKRVPQAKDLENNSAQVDSREFEPGLMATTAGIKKGVPQVQGLEQLYIKARTWVHGNSNQSLWRPGSCAASARPRAPLSLPLSHTRTHTYTHILSLTIAWQHAQIAAELK
eukprot:1154367-Pelagomonas_calceolata.AAC.6